MWLERIADGIKASRYSGTSSARSIEFHKLTTFETLENHLHLCSLRDSSNRYKIEDLLHDLLAARINTGSGYAAGYRDRSRGGLIFQITGVVKRGYVEEVDRGILVYGRH